MIVVLGFSRNAILAIGVAVLFAILVSPRIQSVVRSIRLVSTASLSAAALTLLLFLLPASSATVWFEQQISSFNSRVLDGIRPGAIQADRSAQFRFQGENPYLKEAIAQSPVTGHGFGYPYRPAAVAGRTETDATVDLVYYAHNYYLWIWTKCGLLGGSVLLLTLLSPAIGAVRRRAVSTVGATAPLAGLMAASVVAPMPNGSPTSALVGALCGAGLALLSHSAKTHVDGETPEHPLRPARPALGRQRVESRSHATKFGGSRVGTQTKLGRAPAEPSVLSRNSSRSEPR
ncbi:O-antigen ligase family protein [Aeromicrobium fastidiosum]